MKETRRITFAAIFVALSFVFTLLSITVGPSQFGITEFPLMGSGFVLGPIYGSIVGLVKDVITMLMKGYPPSLFTLSPILLGLIPGLFLVIFGKEKLYSSVPLLAASIYIATIARTINNTFALHYVMGFEWEAILLSLPLKLLAILVEGIVYVIAFRTLLPRIHAIFKDKI